MSVKVIGKHEKDSRACRDALALTLNEMMAEDKSIVYVATRSISKSARVIQSKLSWM